MQRDDAAIAADAAAQFAGYARQDFAALWSIQWKCMKWSEEACEYVRKRLRLDADTPVGYWLLRKYCTMPDIDTVLFEPDIQTVDGNLLTNVGIQRMLDLLGGLGGQSLNATNSRVGVGASAT